jgi:hypothetical protein
MKLYSNFAKRAVLLVLALAVGIPSLGQEGTPSDNSYRHGTAGESPYKSRSIEERDASAEREAQRLVSLPAEKIIVLLAREPGLYLQVKKLLVREAYQEGRVLDPKDLTDEALFRLIREDESQ